MNRRTYLSSVGAVGTIVFSGCLNSSSSNTPSPSTNETPGSANHLGDFVLWNDDDEAHTVTLAVQRDKEQLLSTTETLQPGSSTRIDNPIERQGTYQITATLDDGTESSTDWKISTCNSIEYRQIYISKTGEIKIREMKETVDPTPECE